MKLRILFTLILLSASAAHAQNADKEFQQKAFNSAKTPGDTRIPILCGGFYRAMETLYADRAADAAAFKERSETSSRIGIVVHMMDTRMKKDAATVFIDEKTAQVSDVFADWIAHNKRSSKSVISDGIRNNYTFCEKRYTKWTTVQPKAN